MKSMNTEKKTLNTNVEKEIQQKYNRYEEILNLMKPNDKTKNEKLKRIIITKLVQKFLSGKIPLNKGLKLKDFMLSKDALIEVMTYMSTEEILNFIKGVSLTIYNALDKDTEFTSLLLEYYSNKKIEEYYNDNLPFAFQLISNKGTYRTYTSNSFELFKDIINNKITTNEELKTLNMTDELDRNKTLNSAYIYDPLCKYFILKHNAKFGLNNFIEKGDLTFNNIINMSINELFLCSLGISPKNEFFEILLNDVVMKRFNVLDYFENEKFKNLGNIFNDSYPMGDQEINLETLDNIISNISKDDKNNFNNFFEKYINLSAFQLNSLTKLRTAFAVKNIDIRNKEIEKKANIPASKFFKIVTDPKFTPKIFKLMVNTLVDFELLKDCSPKELDSIENSHNPESMAKKIHTEKKVERTEKKPKNKFNIHHKRR